MSRSRSRSARLAAFVSFAAALIASPAAAQAPGGGSPIAALLPFLQIGLIFVIMYVLLIRPQQKRQKELTKMQGALKKGDWAAFGEAFETLGRLTGQPPIR